MPFTPINILNHEPPSTTGTLITPAVLRHFETQYEKAIADSSGPMRTDTANTLKAELRTTQPTGAAGRIYFNTTTGQLWGFTDAWQEVGE